MKKYHKCAAGLFVGAVIDAFFTAFLGGGARRRQTVSATFPGEQFHAQSRPNNAIWLLLNPKAVKIATNTGRTETWMRKALLFLQVAAQY
jgi:hypothetical protein